MESLNMFLTKTPNSVPLTGKLRYNEDKIIQFRCDGALEILGVKFPNLCTANVNHVKFFLCQKSMGFQQEMERFVVQGLMPEL